SLKARIDAPNSKEWSSATARSNCGATVGLHDVAKCTVPKFSVGATCGCACSCGYAANAGRVRRTAAATIDTRVMCAPWCLIVRPGSERGKPVRPLFGCPGLQSAD